MVRINFYMKEGCWLCDAAQEFLNGLREKYDLRINNVDITEDDGLYERFRFEIPVIEFNDGAMLKGRIKKGELERLLDEHKE
jgi:hypothetical protein